MGIARSTFYDRPAVSFDDTAPRRTNVSDLRQLRGLWLSPHAGRVTSAGHGRNHKKLRRLMREHDLQPRQRRRYVATIDGDHDLPIFPNLAKEIAPNGPDQLWLADITYVAIPAGFA